jgi:cobalt-zinc-cadmium efflux system membrane fusion protein
MNTTDKEMNPTEVAGKGKAPPPEALEVVASTPEAAAPDGAGAAETAAKPRTAGRVRTRVLLAAGGVVVLGLGFLALRGRAEPAPPPAPGPTAPGAAAALATTGPAALQLRPAARARNPVRVARAEMMRLGGDVQVVGAVAFHEDRLAVVGPLVAGRIARLLVGVGDKVRQGQLLAEIESSEVGQARADLVAAQARYAAADANLRRESDLADKKISSSRERELAHAQWVTERAGVRAATMRLRAIGFSPKDIDELETHDPGGRLPIRAPIAGTVIQRLVTLGQAVERATDAFRIADTAKVWVSLDIYEKDLPRVSVGQEVEIRTDARPSEALVGKVAFIVPVIDEATRTAKVRLELANRSGALSAGQLVTARILAGPAQATREVLSVPRSAIEQVEGKTVVFVQKGDGFERRNVQIGASGGDRVEVRSGLGPGEAVAVEGAFLLKSELLR